MAKCKFVNHFGWKRVGTVKQNDQPRYALVRKQNGNYSFEIYGKNGKRNRGDLTRKRTATRVFDGNESDILLTDSFRKNTEREQEGLM